jgi:hypothetical protein
MLNIVTPLSRIENLLTIKENILSLTNWYNSKDFKWIVIVDEFLRSEVNSKFLVENLKESNFHFFWSIYSKSYVGHSHRNYFLNKKCLKFQKHVKSYDCLGNEIKKLPIEYTYFLDDDTILHPEFLETVIPILENEDPEILIFGQNNKDNSVRLLPSYENIKVGHIDMGQYIFKTNSLPDHIRFKEDDYCADGIFIEELFKHHGPEKTKILNKQLSFYNFLR